MSGLEALVREAYSAYSSRDADRLLSLVHDDVGWPDDDGGRLRGKEALREYWREQWTRVRVHDDPREVVPLDDGRVRVVIAQVVRDLGGVELSRGLVTHLLRLRDGRVQWLDIDTAAGGSAADRAEAETPHGVVVRR